MTGIFYFHGIPPPSSPNEDGQDNFIWPQETLHFHLNLAWPSQMGGFKICHTFGRDKFFSNGGWGYFRNTIANFRLDTSRVEPSQYLSSDFVEWSWAVVINIILNSILQLGRSNKFNNQGMKVEVKRAFKSYFCHQKEKNNKKADRLYMKFSSAPNTNIQRCLYSLFRN